MSPSEHELELPPRPTSAAEARRFVGRALEDAAEPARDVGVLLASELVTNALLYAQGRITVRVLETDEAFRVVVGDGSDRQLRPRQAGPEATSGRGLTLVEQLSTAWGVVHIEDDGKEVWFEVPRRT